MDEKKSRLERKRKNRITDADKEAEEALLLDIMLYPRKKMKYVEDSTS